MTEVSRIEFDTRQTEILARGLQRMPELTQREMSVSLQEVLSLLEREVKERTPVGVGGAGGLRGSVTHAMSGIAASGIAGKVYSPLSYAIPVELGTKPHFPPVEPLVDWVQAKLGVPPNEARAVAFLVARKIATKGTEGRHMFEDAFRENTQQILRRLDAAIQRVFAQLGGA